MSKKEKETISTEKDTVSTAAVETVDPVAIVETPENVDPVENVETIEAPACSEEAAMEPETVEEDNAEDAPAEPAVQIYFQYSGTELAANAVVEQVKNIWADLKQDPISSLDLYIKPEEMAAYYVINEEHTGKIDL